MASGGQKPRRARRDGKTNSNFGLDYRNRDPDIVVAFVKLAVTVVRRTWGGR